MGVTVEITLGDDQTLTVGIVDQPSADVEDTQQAQDIQQALKIAGHLLMNPPADGDSDDGSGASGGGADSAGAGASADPSGGGAPDDASSAAPAGAAGGPGGANGGQSAADMWQQMAAQQGPAH